VSVAARRGEVFLMENPGLKERLISTIDKQKRTSPTVQKLFSHLKSPLPLPSEKGED